MFHIVLQFLDDDFLLEWFQTVLFNQLRFFHIHPFIDWSNIFKNLFYVFVLFFWNNGIVLDNSPTLGPSPVAWPPSLSYLQCKALYPVLAAGLSSEMVLT